MSKKFFRRWLPGNHAVRKNRLLARLGPAFHHPRLWHINRQGIALGAAIGGFFGLLVPFGQIPIAAVVAVLMRANLAATVVGTFVTNPFTFAPIYYLAYRIGVRMTGAEPMSAAVSSLSSVEPQGIAEWATQWWQQAQSLGKPLFAGLFVLACLFALVSYFSIDWLWRAIAVRSWKRRAALRTTAPDNNAE